MHDVPPELLDAYRQGNRPAVRLLFLADVETETAEAAIEGGSVSMERGRDTGPRTAQVTLANPAGTYTPSATGLVWPYRLVRLERGVYVNDVPLYAPLITGILAKPRLAEGSGQVSFDVWSRLVLADRQFTQPLSLPAGTRLRVAVRTLAELGGMGSADAWYDLQDGGVTLAAAAVYDVDDNILRSMATLAKDHALVLRDDGLGRLVLRPFVDPSTVTPVWHFIAGAASVTLSIQREIDPGQAYNRAIVDGLGADGYPLRAEARVNDPGSPLHWTTDNDWPMRPYRPDYAATQGQLNALAVQLLYANAPYEERIDLSALPLPGLEAGDVVHITGAGVDDNYQIDALGIPLGLGQMSLRTSRVRSLVA